MATTPAPYDPLKSLDGMWTGSLIRLAYYFKDPASYGQQTQTVLRETAKRYQDALDDCEIQILEAKWYLEHRLATNRARRAQKALENTSIIAKRKLDSMVDGSDGKPEDTGDNPAKRIKIQDAKDDEAAGAGTKPAQAEQGATEEASADAAGSSLTELEASIAAPVQPKPEEEAAKPATEPEKPPNIDTSQGSKLEITSQDEPKTSGPVSSIGENQEFNFDSMFDDPGDTGDPNTGDMNFDMDLGADTFANSMNIEQANKPASPDSLLPGLETYANQTGDDLGMNFSSSTGMDGTGGVSGNIFDLPDLGGSTFDDLLNDDNLGGGMGHGADDMLNDDSMMNMGDLDSFFN